MAVGLGEGFTDLSDNPLPPARFSFTIGEARTGGEPQVLEFRPPPAADAAPGDPLLVVLDRPLRRATGGEDLFVSSDGRWAPGNSELLFGGRVLRFRADPKAAPGRARRCKARKAYLRRLGRHRRSEYFLLRYPPRPIRPSSRVEHLAGYCFRG